MIAITSKIDASNFQEYQDKALGVCRWAAITGGKLQLLLNISWSPHQPELPDRNWLGSLFNTEKIKRPERLALLSGLPSAGVEDVGNIVCACFNVGEKTILKAAKESKLSSYQQVGEACKAGTNCGSCVPEIKALLLT